MANKWQARTISGGTTLQNYAKADAEFTLKMWAQLTAEEDRRTLEAVRTAIWCLFAAVVLFELLRP